MRVVVTGGQGFIGNYVVRSLASHGHGVTVIDTQFPREGFPSANASLINGDVLNRDFMGAIASTDVDAVVHMVAMADQNVAHKAPQFSFRLNVESLQIMLEACRVNDIPRVVFPSTAAVYGPSPRIPVQEDDALWPQSLYAYHKVIGEQLIEAYQRNYGISFTVFRLFNVYGKGHKGLLEHCLQKSRLGETMKVFGAEQKRDFVHVDDVARAISEGVESKSCHNKIINVGTGQGHSIRELIGVMQGLLPTLKAEYQERPDVVMYDSVAGMARFQEAFGHVPDGAVDFIRERIEREMLERPEPKLEPDAEGEGFVLARA